MLQRETKVSSVKKGIAVVMMLCLLCATTVLAVTKKGELITGLKYTWTGTYQDGILAGRTKAAINTESRSYNEVRLYKPGDGYIQTKTVYGDESGRKNVYTSKRVGTGKEDLRVYHTTANRGVGVTGNGYTASANGASMY